MAKAVKNEAGRGVVAQAHAALDDLEARWLEHIRLARKVLDGLEGQNTGRRPVAVYQCRVESASHSGIPNEVVYRSIPGNEGMNLHVPVLRAMNLPYSTAADRARCVQLEDGKDYEAVVLIFEHEPEKKETR